MCGHINSAILSLKFLEFHVNNGMDLKCDSSQDKIWQNDLIKF
jgi:hypothetical protein